MEKSTNKEMSKFLDKVYNAVKSEDMLQVVKVCAGKLTYLTLCEIQGTGFREIEGDIICEAIKEAASASNEIGFNNVFYKSMSQQLATAFCHNLHTDSRFADKEFDTFVLLSERDVPTSIRIYMKEGYKYTDSMDFEINAYLSDEVIKWLEAR